MANSKLNPTASASSVSQTDRAVLGIRELVLRGEFKVGERLTELALVDKLGVSRTPIRAALLQLAEEGLLEAAQPSGYAVRSFSESDINDAIEVRGTLEGLAARLAAERGVSQLFLDQMGECLDEIDQVLADAQPGDEHLSRYAALNTRFHNMMVEASGSSMVGHALARIASLPFAGPNAFVEAQDKLPGSLEILKQAQAQHRDMLQAIGERSSARAEPLTREHARNARKNLELVMRNKEARARLVGIQLIRQRGG
ncbi:MAG TPA: GntR family transcriptional regulator [Rhodocyclaceae bacterium]|nr:GntR family transcriptional regulator [Rhodocyclaceae bacterium]